MKILFVKETFVHSIKETVSFAHMKQNSKCKGPEAEKCLGTRRKLEASVTGVESER